MLSCLLEHQMGAVHGQMPRCLGSYPKGTSTRSSGFQGMRWNLNSASCTLARPNPKTSSNGYLDAWGETETFGLSQISSCNFLCEQTSLLDDDSSEGTPGTLKKSMLHGRNIQTAFVCAKNCTCHCKQTPSPQLWGARTCWEAIASPWYIVE